MGIRKISWHAMRRALFARIRDELRGLPSIDLRAANPKGNVILCHGWREHMTFPTFIAFAFAVHASGYNVYVFDWPNHGKNLKQEGPAAVFATSRWSTAASAWRLRCGAGARRQVPGAASRPARR